MDKIIYTNLPTNLTEQQIIILFSFFGGCLVVGLILWCVLGLLSRRKEKLSKNREIKE